jgi:hypothetical protein
MSQIGHLVVTRGIAIERPSDHLWFRFETYLLNPGEWGFNLTHADGHPTKSISDPDWKSESQVVDWLRENIEGWGHVDGLGWCSDGREQPAAMKM